MSAEAAHELNKSEMIFVPATSSVISVRVAKDQIVFCISVICVTNLPKGLSGGSERVPVMARRRGGRCQRKRGQGARAGARARDPGARRAGEGALQGNATGRLPAGKEKLSELVRGLAPRRSRGAAGANPGAGARRREHSHVEHFKTSSGFDVLRLGP